MGKGRGGDSCISDGKYRLTEKEGELNGPPEGKINVRTGTVGGTHELFTFAPFT